MTPTHRAWDCSIAIVLALSGLFYHWTYAFYGPINLIDVGIYVSDAMRVLHGEVYGRDFIAPYGPLGSYGLAATFHFLGPSLVSATWFWLACHFLINFLHYLLARTVLPRMASVATTLCLVVAYGPLHKALVGLVLVSCAMLGTAVIRHRGQKVAFLAGLMFVVMGLIRWDSSLFVGVPLLIILVLSDKRARFAGLAVGAIVGSALVTLVYALISNPAAILQDTWERVLNTKNAPSPGTGTEGELLLQWLQDPATLSLFVLSVLAVLGGLSVFLLRRFMGKVDPWTLTLGLLSLSSLLALNQVRLLPKYERLSESWAMILILFMVGLNRALPSRVWKPAALLVPFIALIAYNAHATWFISQASWTARSFATQRLELERGGTHLQPGAAQNLKAVVDFIRENTQEGEAIYATPNVPAIYFLADRPNPTRVNGFVYIYRNERIQKEIREDLEKARPRFVITHDKPIMGFLFEDEVPIIHEWIVTHYTPLRRIGLYTVWGALSGN